MPFLEFRAWQCVTNATTEQTDPQFTASVLKQQVYDGCDDDDVDNDHLTKVDYFCLRNTSSQQVPPFAVRSVFFIGFRILYKRFPFGYRRIIGVHVLTMD